MLLLPLGPEADSLDEEGVSRPVLTYLWIGAMFLVHAAWGLGLPPQEGSWIPWTYGFRVEDPFGPGLGTHLLVHRDVVQLLAGTFFLAAFGSAVEVGLGRLAFLLVASLASFAGAFAYQSLATPQTVQGVAGVTYPLLGAGAACAGFFASLLPLAPTLRIQMAVWFFGFWSTVSVSCWGFALLFLLFEGIRFVAAPGQGPSYFAAGAGLLAGLLVGAAWAAFRRLRPDPEEAQRAEILNAGITLEAVAPPPRAVAQAEAEAEDDLEVSAVVPVVNPVTVEDVLEASVHSLEEADDATASASRDGLPHPGRPPPAKKISELAEEARWTRDRKKSKLDHKFRRARELEKAGGKARVQAFHFYVKALQNDELPSSYRSFAGARACRLLLKSGQFDQAERMARKLLKKKLPKDLKGHVKDTLKRALEKQDASRA